MMAGMIMLWGGAVVDIPPHWFLCDGEHGTPNLTDRFIVGNGNDYPLNSHGGIEDHQHVFIGDGHTHDLQAEATVETNANVRLLTGKVTGSTQVTGETDNQSYKLPYYALAYIMLSPWWTKVEVKAGYKLKLMDKLTVVIRFGGEMDTTKVPANASLEIYKDGNPCGIFRPAEWMDEWTLHVVGDCPYGGTVIEWELKNIDNNFMSANGELVQPIRIDCSLLWS